MKIHNILASVATGIALLPSVAFAFTPANSATPETLPPVSSSHQAPPLAPNPMAGQNFGVVSQAGVGSTVAYSRAGVIELGGGLSWLSEDKTNRLTITPQVGWFATDNVELSTMLQWELDGVKTRRVTFLVEPSFHLPLAQQLFIFGGLGVGAAYKSEGSVGFALAPRAGFNVLVGRSGILTPSVTWATSTNRAEAAQEGQTLLAVNSRWNLNLGYSVMW